MLALVSMLILGLAGCGAPPEPEQAAQPEAAPPTPPPAPVTLYELTKDDITTQPEWTSRNVTVLGVKLGDITRNVEKNLGELTNTRTGTEDYITAYKDGGVVVYTFKLTGKARKIEVTQFLTGIKDAKIARALSNGSEAAMRDAFGMEEAVEENADDMSTEYSYDSKGFRFVKYKVGNRTVNAIRFSEMRATT
jgi:hypothetical protein